MTSLKFMQMKKSTQLSGSGCGLTLKNSLLHALAGISGIVNVHESASPGRHAIRSSSKISPSSHEKLTRPPTMQTKKCWQLFSRRETRKNSSRQSISCAIVEVIAQNAMRTIATDFNKEEEISKEIQLTKLFNNYSYDISFSINYYIHSTTNHDAIKCEFKSCLNRKLVTAFNFKCFSISHR